ncbi:hypothetical protein B4U80_12485 [Leptotrombidium deliense]|uniref:Uncharacterized protein n=1 Tax=Leptotrombidium deliense TaxID=299467 RepID=A0A443SSL1_9ACAR|nr:hypothetical protein B4U80_12485 [Leptotrombidium deliense]
MPRICPEIESMIISGMQFDGDSFANILRPKFEHLTKLVLQSCEVKPSVPFINRTSGNNFSPNYFEHIRLVGEYLPNLEELVVQNMKIKELSLREAFRNLYKLRALEISHCFLRGFCFKDLSLTCTAITLNGCRIDEQGFHMLMYRLGSRLEYLEFNNEDTHNINRDEQVYFDLICRYCSKLRKVTFKADTDLSVDKIGQLTALTDLNLCVNRVLDFNAQLTGSKVNHLYLNCDELYSRTLMNMVLRHSFLSHVFIFTKNANSLKEGIEKVALIPNLTSLTFLSKNGTIAGDIITTIIERSSTLSHLRIATLTVKDSIYLFNALFRFGGMNPCRKITVECRLEKSAAVNKEVMKRLPANITLRFVQRWETDFWYYP